MPDKAPEIASHILTERQPIELALECLRLGAPVSSINSSAVDPTSHEIGMDHERYHLDEINVRRWVSSIGVLARADDSRLDGELKRIEGVGWYRCWLRYLIGLSKAEAKGHGGNPAKAFTAARKAHPEARFHTLFHSVGDLYRFGHTGAFDLLCLLGKLGVLPIRPGSCYLSGSPGPLAGARKLWGKRRPSELLLVADRTANVLGIPYDVFEDGLCMWQK